jgi:hypothetical protein
MGTGVVLEICSMSASTPRPLNEHKISTSIAEEKGTRTTLGSQSPWAQFCH